jgi:putative tryptophan/tyrosine transport system substrate-binding protein
MLMRRATLMTTLLLLALVVLVVPLATEAQHLGQVHRIGVLVGGMVAGPWFPEFRAGLRELGYAEGKDLLIEYRFSEGKADRLPQLAADLVGLKVKVIVAVFATPARAAHQATRSIPIVGIGIGDPVGIGLSASLARPGGNVTGTASYLPELGGKPLEVLKEVIPHLKRLGVLWNPSNPTHAPLLKDGEPIARSLAIQLQPVQAVNPEDLEGALRSAARTAEAVWVLGDAMFVGHRARIVALAAAAGLPTLSAGPPIVEAGGLMSHGPDLPTMFRRAATNVDRILKGARPGDLPIEQPTRFDIVIDLKTAKALGLRVPQSVLLQANRVIE